MINEERDTLCLLGAGLACLDIIDAGGKIRYYNGGSCGNVVSGLSFLGWKNTILTGPYRDEASKLLYCNFDRLGVQKIEVNQGSTFTPRIIEEFNSERNKEHRFLSVCPRCGSKMPKLSPLKENSVKNLDIDNFDVFYSDRTSKGIVLIRKLFKDKGLWTVYEPNISLNVQSLLNNALDSHIVKFSADIVSPDLAEKIRNESRNGSTVLIVQTMAEKGLTYSYRKRDNTMSGWEHLDSHPIPGFLDSCGAGDWCTTGLLYRLGSKYPRFTKYLAQQDVREALQFGQALSAISCCFLGAQGLIYNEVDEAIERRLLGSQSRIFSKHLSPAGPPGDLGPAYCNYCLLL